MLVDADVEISEPIQPDTTGVSSVVPSLQIEAATEKVLYPLRHPLCDKPIQTS